MYNPFGTKEYRNNDVMGASPVRLVIMAYDVAINACEQRDFARAIQAVSVLRDALNHDYQDVSGGLFRLYQWCLDCIRKEDYVTAAHTLQELRQAWAIVEKRSMQAPMPAGVTSRIAAGV